MLNRKLTVKYCQHMLCCNKLFCTHLPLVWNFCVFMDTKLQPIMFIKFSPFSCNIPWFNVNSVRRIKTNTKPHHTTNHWLAHWDITYFPEKYGRMFLSYMFTMCCLLCNILLRGVSSRGRWLAMVGLLWLSSALGGVYQFIRWRPEVAGWSFGFSSSDTLLVI